MNNNIKIQHNLLDHGKDGVIILDHNQMVTYLNKSAMSILKADRNVVGRDVHDVFRVKNYYTKEHDDNLINKVYLTQEPTGLKKESALLTFEDKLVFVSASISPIIEEGLKGAVIFFKDITRLKNTELELSKFRKAFENSIESVIITDDEWQIEYCNNKSKKRITKCHDGEKQVLWNVCGYQLTWMEKNVIIEDLSKDNYWVGEIRGDGPKEKWYKVSIIALKDVVGKTINYVLSEVDVTFEKESKRLLINERKNLSTIIDGAPVGMMTVTKEFSVLQINEECRSVIGVPLKRSQNLMVVQENNKNLELVVNLIKRVLSTSGAIRNYEFSLYRTFGEKKHKRWIKANAVPITISEKKCVLLSFEDETIKKDMAKTIVRNERQLRLVTDNMQDIITQISLSGEIEYYSASFRSLIGQAGYEKKSQNLYEHIYLEDQEILKRMLSKCSVSHENLKFEIRFISSVNEAVWLEVMMKYIENDERDASFLLYGRDVTQRRIAEQEIINSKEIAIAANNAKSEFLANMSHEIRTPLNGIIGMANVSLMNETDYKQKDNISMIKHSAENLLKIINSVLDFSKIEAGKLMIEKHNLNLKSELKRLIKPFKLQADQKEIALHCQIDEKINDNLLSDITRLMQIITNLIGNAIKFTEFGSVTFSAVCIKEDANTQWIQFIIKDTGIGIKNEDKHKIFKSFSQADGSVTRKFGGTGLGLNITKKIVELMNGTIAFNSNYGDGSEFICTFPFSKGDSQIKITHEDKIVEADTVGLGYNILVVEDDKINQKLAQRLLKRKGYGITLVSNGKEAVDIYEDGRFDLILMDIQMPIMDGLTATKLIREKSNSMVPIVALTAYAIKGDREKFLRKGMDDYISKPIDLDEFYRVLDKHLKSHKVEETAIQRILDKINKAQTTQVTDDHKLFDENFDKLNMQLKYIASSIIKSNYEKLEERCYAFKNNVTSLGMTKLRKLIFTLELHIRKENEDKIVDSYQEIVNYINSKCNQTLKGVEINENFNRRR